MLSSFTKIVLDLGVEPLAEGVETEQEEDLLRRQGCDEIQGYLYSRPLVPRELAHWLRDAATGASMRDTAAVLAG